MDELTKTQAQNFDTLGLAFTTNRACLMVGKIRSTGEDVAVICMVNDDGEGNIDLVPVGHLCPADNPFEYYMSVLEIDKVEGEQL